MAFSTADRVRHWTSSTRINHNCLRTDAVVRKSTPKIKLLFTWTLNISNIRVKFFVRKYHVLSDFVATGHLCRSIETFAKIIVCILYAWQHTWLKTFSKRNCVRNTMLVCVCVLGREEMFDFVGGELLAKD